MTRKVHRLCQVALVAGLWAGPAASETARPAPAQAFDRCPATLVELWDFVGKLAVQSKTPTLESDDSTTFYMPSSVTVLGTRPLAFQAYIVRGQAVRITATLPGRFQQYEAVLPRDPRAEANCGPERCEWMRTDEVPRGSLSHAYLVQDRAGRKTTLGCGYVR